jgi:adenosylcobinamide kinase / adenosylcobinamide-phosphate guanylyltransferase
MLTLVLGGARSGKSRYAQSLCRTDEVAYIATATIAPGDDEMANRVKRHQRDRPATWATIDAPLRVPDAVRDTPQMATVLLDCITLWISNLLEHHAARDATDRERLVLEAVNGLTAAMGTRHVIAVSNEVGSGLVPMNRLGRQFRDLHGLANQVLAREAVNVVLMVAGAGHDQGGRARSEAAHTPVREQAC